MVGTVTKFPPKSWQAGRWLFTEDNIRSHQECLPLCQWNSCRLIRSKLIFLHGASGVCLYCVLFVQEGLLNLFENVGKVKKVRLIKNNAVNNTTCYG